MLCNYLPLWHACITDVLSGLLVWASHLECPEGECIMKSITTVSRLIVAPIDNIRVHADTQYFSDLTLDAGVW